ncbi:uncharacterized protein LOC117102856 [Anneissia japonica]|uniref:uncharacterized protein LOC117102856 n=1 Tax=Anneissia japonica TaxID=1529436 RepID=UPI0014259B42|nr:uncharacterized protein LOC117102856 [Anneissia japonica]
MVNDFHHLMPSHVNDSSVYQLPDVNVIKALSKYEEQDFESVSKHLDLIPGCSLSNPIKISTSDWQTCCWNPVDHGTKSMLELIRGVTHLHTSGSAASLYSHTNHPQL